jgi:hypothetical protein
MRSLLLLVSLTLGGCCVTKDEHRAFVESSRAFFNAVAPVFSEAIAGDASLSQRNKQNRLGVVEDYQRALSAAEGRAR